MFTDKEIQLIKDSLSTDNLKDLAVGQRITHSIYGKGKIVDRDENNNFIVDFNGDKTTLSYPYAFVSLIKFEEESINEYVEALLEVYEQALELVAEFANQPDLLYSLYVFKMVKNHHLETDIELARKEELDLLYRAAIAGDDIAQDCLLANCSRQIEDGINVDDTIIQFALNIMENKVENGDALAVSIVADYYCTTEEYKEAEKFLKKNADNDFVCNEIRGEDAARLARIYFTGKKHNLPEKRIYRNYQLAKKYYDIAAKCGYECNADITFIEKILGIEVRQNAMKIMAHKVIEDNYTKTETYNFVMSNLCDEFGNQWNNLPKAAQIDLISGCMVYCDLYSLGEKICNNIDFSAAIIPIVKAAEVVFREYLCYRYHDYLKERNIPAQRLHSRHPFVEYDKRNRSYKYIEKESIIFTLGSIKWIIIDPEKRDVYPEFLAYAKNLMGMQVGSTMEVKEYLVRLSQKMSQFTFDIRNPAAHSEIMPYWQAEICGNEIILVKKILKEFVSKINL